MKKVLMKTLYLKVQIWWSLFRFFNTKKFVPRKLVDCINEIRCHYIRAWWANERPAYGEFLKAVCAIRDRKVKSVKKDVELPAKSEEEKDYRPSTKEERAAISDAIFDLAEIINNINRGMASCEKKY